MLSKPKIIGVIIAGGKSSRMGGNEKCMLSLADKTILSEIIDRLSSQVYKILINANGDTSRFDFTNLPVAKDIIDGNQGPLAGIYTGMSWVKNNISDDAIIACVPSDAPFIPKNLVEKLYKAYNNEKADIACVASSDGHLHPIFNLMPVSLYDNLHDKLTNTNTRAIYKWFKTHKLAKVEFEEENNIDPFFNINTPDELKKAKYIIN